MTGKTHAMIGANVVWIPHLLGVPVDPWLIPAGAFAALLPDLDASESMIKNLEVGIGNGKGRLRIKPLVPVALLFAALFRHRGWLHSWVAVVVVAALSVAFLERVGSAAAVVLTLGYLSHLIADALTPSGIEFLLPIKRRVHLLPKPFRIRTGSIIDHGFFFLGALLFVLFISQQFHWGWIQ